jgi:hypothetical protein
MFSVMSVYADVYSNALLAIILSTIENTFTLKSPLTPLFQRVPKAFGIPLAKGS